MNTINNIDSSDCTGCSACANICPKNCISMVNNENGFLEPVVNSEQCIMCGKCYQICKEKTKRYKLDKAFAFISHHKNILLNCSSGGAYGTICKIINAMYSDVVFYGAMFDSDLNVKHGFVENIDDVRIFYGSKYVQSRMNDVYKSIELHLLKNKIVFFSGTPCQVNGVKRYLSMKNIKDDRLITVDIMCHGVPSEKIWNDYIDNTEKKYRRKIIDYSFRAKELGWKNYPMRITFEDKCINNRFADRTYINLFRSHLIFRNSCYRCKFATRERVGDITIADFWGVEKCISGIDVNQGVSLVIPNNQKGIDIVGRMEDEGVLLKADYLSAANLQNNMNRPCECPDNIKDFWEYYLKNGYVKAAKKYSNTNFIGFIKLRIKMLLNR